MSHLNVTHFKGEIAKFILFSSYVSDSLLTEQAAQRAIDPAAMFSLKMPLVEMNRVFQ